MKLFTLFMLTILSIKTYAQSVEMQAVHTEDRIARKDGGQLIPKFAQWGENEVYAQYNRDPKTRRHLDVNLGFRYLMTNSIMPIKDDWEYALAFAYQGAFDFFAFTRDSGPVISTRNNPSIFYTRYRNPEHHNFTSWTLSFEHESNGQSTDDQASLFNVIRSFKREYRHDKSVTTDDVIEMARQTISRSNNFLAIAGNYQVSGLETQTCDRIMYCVNMFVKLRHQLDFGLEDDIWWEPNRNDSLKKFIGTRIELNTTFEQWEIKQGIKLTLQTGQLIGGSPLKNNTFDVKYYVDVPVGKWLSKHTTWFDSELFALPLVIQYHNGYLEELYQYSERSNYWAIGLHAKY